MKVSGRNSIRDLHPGDPVVVMEDCLLKEGPDKGTLLQAGRIVSFCRRKGGLLRISGDRSGWIRSQDVAAIDVAAGHWRKLADANNASEDTISHAIVMLIADGQLGPAVGLAKRVDKLEDKAVATVLASLSARIAESGVTPVKKQIQEICSHGDVLPDYYASSLLAQLSCYGEWDVAKEVVDASDLSQAASVSLLGKASVVSFKTGSQELGFRLIRQAVKRDPEDVLAQLYLATALRAVGENAKAVDSLKAFLRLNPAADDAYRLLGESLAALGDKAAAIDSLKKAIAISSSNAQAHNLLGRLLLLNEVDTARPTGSKKRDIALRHLEKSCELSSYKDIEYVKTYCYGLVLDGSHRRAYAIVDVCLDEPGVSDKEATLLLELRSWLQAFANSLEGKGEE